MAALTHAGADLDVAARAVLFGPRGVRLEVLNVFRVQNSKTELTAMVNGSTYSQAQIDAAKSGLEGDVDNAAGGSVTADSTELELLFEAALTSGRELRLFLVNQAREVLGLGPVDYLVNAEMPTRAQIDTALSNLEND